MAPQTLLLCTYVILDHAQNCVDCHTIHGLLRCEQGLNHDLFFFLNILLKVIKMHRVGTGLEYILYFVSKESRKTALSLEDIDQVTR